MLTNIVVETVDGETRVTADVRGRPANVYSHYVDNLRIAQIRVPSDQQAALAEAMTALHKAVCGWVRAAHVQTS